MNENLLNIKSMSLAKVLLLFYLFIANNYTNKLYSGQLTDYISSNRYVQHIIGLITMLVLLNLVADVEDPYELIVFSIVLYLWFIITTKMDLKWSLGIICFMIVGYIFESYMQSVEHRHNKDQALGDDFRRKIKHNHKKCKAVIVIILLIITLFGSSLYFHKKMDQYGGDFDANKFLFNARN